MSKETTKGSCYCGAVAYEIRRDPVRVGYCHCRMCRRHTGAPVAAVAAFPVSNVSISGPMSFLHSSAEAKRGFCGECGTPLSWHGHAWDQDVIAFHLSTLKNPEDFEPSEHWHVGSALPWLKIDDDLPRLEEVED